MGDWKGIAKIIRNAVWLAILWGWTCWGIEADAARNHKDDWAVVVWADHGRPPSKDAANHYKLQLFTTDRGTPLLVVHVGNDQDPDVKATLAPLEYIVREDKPFDQSMEIPLNGSADEVLSAVVMHVLERFPERKTMLVFIGHGSDILENTYGRPTRALSINEMRKGLEQVKHVTKRNVDIIVLDTCYGLTLETAHELRENCQFILGTPGLIQTPGIRWDKVLTKEMESSNPENIANYIIYSGQETENEVNGQTVALRMMHIEGLVKKTAVLARMMIENVDEEIVLIRLARNRSKSWGQRNELVDLGEFAGQLAQWAKCENVRQAALDVAKACMDVLGIESMTDGSENKKICSGIAVYFPATVEEPPLAYLENHFAQDGLWGQWLKELWEHTTVMLYGRH